MPNLQGLVEEGVSGNLATLEPTLSPMLWNSIATGKRAGAHGIHGFTDVHPETGDVVPVSSLQRRCNQARWLSLRHRVQWKLNQLPRCCTDLGERKPQVTIPLLARQVAR